MNDVSQENDNLKERLLQPEGGAAKWEISGLVDLVTWLGSPHKWEDNLSGGMRLDPCNATQFNQLKPKCDEECMGPAISY